MTLAGGGVCRWMEMGADGRSRAGVLRRKRRKNRRRSRRVT